MKTTFALLAAVALCGVPALARGQVRLTLGNNDRITPAFFTSGNADTVVAGLNAGASAGTQFDPRLIPAGSGGGDSEQTPRYPVFIIPLGGGYTDFEIKATRLNFVSNSLTYIFSSAVHTQSTEAGWDPSPLIYLCHAPGDSRTWHQADPAAPIYGQIGASPGNARVNQVVFIPSRTFVKANANEVWSYVRINAFGPETDQNGFVVFSPLVPVDWRSAQIVP